uniref:Uncharacterized protein n=1 Tax=Setaria digitata TaxID=48799 RepID=A0A915Q747_9BILA
MSGESKEMNQANITVNNGINSKLTQDKKLSFDISVVRDDLTSSTFTSMIHSSSDAGDNRETLNSSTAHVGSICNKTKSEIAPMIDQESDRSEDFESRKRSIIESEKETVNHGIKASLDSANEIQQKCGAEQKSNGQQNYEVENDQLTKQYDAQAHYENGESRDYAGAYHSTEEKRDDITSAMRAFQQTDSSTLYQQPNEYQQYTYGYNEPQTYSYEEAQSVNYDYSSTLYQDYGQISYPSNYPRYDQQSTTGQDYRHQFEMPGNDDQQSTALSDYGRSQYDQLHEYGYGGYGQTVDYDSYTSSHVPLANDQNCTNVENSESCPGITNEASNNYGMQQNQQDIIENPTRSTNVTSGRSPMVPQYIAPLFPSVISTEPNPFSWEAQESAMIPNVTVSTSQNFIPSSQSQSEETYQHGIATKESPNSTQNIKESKRKPPLRPAPPSPSVELPVRPPPIPPSPKLTHASESARKQETVSKLTKSESDEDAWAKFNKLTEKATTAVKTTEERLKELRETTAAKDIKDESYLAQIGGSQAYIPEQAYKQAREQASITGQVKEKKKMLKHDKTKKTIEENVMTLAQEDDLDRAAMELAKKMAAARIDLQDWKPPAGQQILPGSDKKPIESSDDASPPRQESASVVLGRKIAGIIPEESSSTTTFNHETNNINWTGFDDSQPTDLPPSESGFFTYASGVIASPDKAFGDCLAVSEKVDNAFSPVNENLIQEDYDPFNVRSADDLVEEAKARAAAAIAAEEIHDDLNLFATKLTEQRSDISSPTQEGGSPASSRPAGFDDEFQVEDNAGSTPSPLYDEDDSEPLTEFPAKFTGDGWEMMIRYPIKKKIMSDRYWKPCYVRLRDSTLFMFNSKTEQKPFMEILLQATYSLSDPTLQAYDVYGKIHTVKLQYVSYKERVGIRPGQISRLVEGHVTKYGLPLEHSAQSTVLLKFGSLNAAELFTFVTTIEDILFRCVAVRNTAPVYKQDEVQIHCYDEYAAYVDKFNILSNQKARVRLFCLAFISGSPILEIGLNDRRRQGKEIVRRKDILPMYTERWIRFENLEFHNTVEQEAFEKEQVIRLSPPDGCFFEVMRFRVRPPKNREKPLTVKCVMKIAGSKVEIRIEAMAAAHTEKSKGNFSSKRQVPCEDIQIRFPVPEAWIYLFREERRWGVGSVHAKVRRPGKVKNLKDRLMGTVHNIDNSLIEAAIGEAKYEHVFRALVWRIPRLPEKYHAAYREHLLRCRFELSSFDLMPETFAPTCDVEFTMPLAMISNTVIRSVSVEQHEDSDRVEKFVRYVAKCTYQVEIDYVQCSDLDIDAIFDPTVANPEAIQEAPPEPHKAMFNPDEVKEIHGGYRIDFSDAEIGAKMRSAEDSSSDEEEEERRPLPVIQIDPKGYSY